MRELYARNVYLRHHDTGVIGPGDTVVDLGCNNGLFTLLAAKHGARVIAVDAQSGFSGPYRPSLQPTASSMGASFVSALIGGDRGLFRDRAVLTTGSHYADTPTERTMDDLLADVDRVAFLKVDVEGSEFAIFAGALPWLSKVDALAWRRMPILATRPRCWRRCAATGSRPSCTRSSTSTRGAPRACFNPP